MIGLDDFEVVKDTLNSVLSVDNFQFSIGTVNRNSEMKMLCFNFLVNKYLSTYTHFHIDIARYYKYS